MSLQAPRWEHHVAMRAGAVEVFWNQHLQNTNRSVLFVLGRGFDPRTTIGLKAVLAAGKARCDVLGIELNEGTESASLRHLPLSDQNWATVESAIAARGTVRTHTLALWSPEGRRISSQGARDLFSSAGAFADYTDVVVDISAMPRSVYFPLIARIMYLLDRSPTEPRKNLHVLVADDPALDARIQEEGIDEKAEFMASFGGGFDEEGTPTPKVWLPMLGENRTTQFARILDRVKPDEVCPVLPSPSRDPRRADNIVVEYQRALFDEQRLDPKKFLYASEHNPFEVYRQLRAAVVRYDKVFKLLGGCRVALSALSSKLMSMGALLVAYELKTLGTGGIGLAHIESQGYSLGHDVLKMEPELFGLWLTGECDA